MIVDSNELTKPDHKDIIRKEFEVISLLNIF